MNKNIYGVYFICCSGNYLYIIDEQLKELNNSGLYKMCKNIIIFICSYNPRNIHLNKLIKYYDPDNKYLVITIRENLYEKFAINNYKEYIQDNDYYLFYFHTKGISRKNEKIYQNRRKILNFYTLTKYQICIELLENYDCVGCSLTMNPSLHYSGNFWWTTSNHLKKLPLKIGNSYLDPEMYICSNKTSRYISLSQNTNDGIIEKHIYRNDEDIKKNVSSNVINNKL